MNIAYLGLGSNIGDRKQYLHEALKLLTNHPKINVTVISSLYETKPWGYTDQDIFMNLVVEVQTSLTPIELLDVCLKIEQDLGRVRLIKWGPRVIDIDILLYEDVVVETERLSIPHPYMSQRDFVVIPLAEISPQLKLNGKTIEEYALSFDAANLIKISKR